jgi:thiol-disulfide isomerase/thioredoxin
MKLLLSLAVALALSAPIRDLPLAQADAGSSTISADELKALPSINLKDFEGKAVSADELRGNIVVLDFWATWCAPCIVEIPALNKLQEKYEEQGVKVVGVTMASGEAKEVKPFITRHKMKYRVLMGDDDQIYDFNVIAFPTTYVITRDLKVFRRYIGTGPQKANEIEADIKKLLATN